MHVRSIPQVRYCSCADLNFFLRDLQMQSCRCFKIRCFLKFVTNTNLFQSNQSIQRNCLSLALLFQTYIYQPNDKRLRSSPAPLPSDLEPFSFSSIPVHYREKYRVASRFVDLCKSKTIKHSIWTNEARCNLMRNEPHPNVETNFGNGELD